MTTEQKAKAYDKALKKARQLCGYPTTKPFISDLQDLFPELCESEDERMKKSIIQTLKKYSKCVEDGNDSPSAKDFLVKDIENQIAWLEKQKEPELSEDLGEYVTELNKQFPEISFAKLSRIAVRVKNWLEKQGDNNEDADILQRFSFYSYKDEPNVLYLSNVFVNEEYCNKGIGTKILKIADEVSTYLKCNSIRLKTENGSNAESLYRKNGYKTLKEEGNQIWLEKQSCQKSVDKEYTFKSIPRLLDMIEPTDRAKSYCKKLIDTLLQEGYVTDAKIVSDCLKQMNGEKVAMAIMDIENQGEHRFVIGDIISNGKVEYRVDNIVKNAIGQDCYFLVNIENEKNGIRYLQVTNSEGKTHNYGEITWLCEQVDAKFEKQGEMSKNCPTSVQDKSPININEMVAKYSQTKDGDFGLPINCQIRAYRKGINDTLCMALKLEKQGEQKPYMIQWKGNNLKEIVEFTGKSPKFGEWFKTWEEYENYVHSHGNIFKLFCEDGSHYEVPVSAWIVKTPDGYNIASKAKYKQNIEQKPYGQREECLDCQFNYVGECKSSCAMKRNEQKPSNKVEPKFKVGDWIVNDYCFGKVIEITNDAYLLDTGQGIPFSCEHNVHLWTIQDAKDGDVLVFKNNIGGIIICKSPSDYDTRSYCRLIRDNLINKEESGWDSTLLVPATKEQCDLLFSKMKEVGYEWNSEKKELKKLSQRMILTEVKEALYDKPTDEEMKELLRTEYEKGRADTLSEMKSSWSEEDEKTLNEIFSVAARASLRKSTLFGKSYDYIKWQNWLKSLRDRVQPQPKQEWSEEDKKMIEATINLAHEYGRHGLWVWLKSLKDRVIPQPKPAWSEEDETGWTNTMIMIKEVASNHYTKDSIKLVIDWLKSLKDRYTWKPSSEQIDTLEHFVRSIGESGYASPYDNNTKLLYSLLKQLKKLKA